MIAMLEKMKILILLRHMCFSQMVNLRVSVKATCLQL